LRGKVGIVMAKQGIFKDPEKLALGKPGLPKRPLYLVKFLQKDLWESYQGFNKDALVADIYEHWLDIR